MKTNGEIYQKGYKDGANWQKEQDKAIIVELLELLKLINPAKGIIMNYDLYQDAVNEAITKAENHLK